MENRIVAPHSEEHLLCNDNGTEFRFKGKLFSESSYFDEEISTMTRLRLYVTADSLLVYSIISVAGREKQRRYYTVRVKGESCTMSDGRQTLVLPLDMLFTSVFGLCGIEPTRAEKLRPVIEETLRAVNDI